MNVTLFIPAISVFPRSCPQEGIASEIINKMSKFGKMKSNCVNYLNLPSATKAYVPGFDAKLD